MHAAGTLCLATPLVALLCSKPLHAIHLEHLRQNLLQVGMAAMDTTNMKLSLMQFVESTRTYNNTQ